MYRFCAVTLPELEGHNSRISGTFIESCSLDYSLVLGHSIPLPTHVPSTSFQLIPAPTSASTDLLPICFFCTLCQNGTSQSVLLCLVSLCVCVMCLVTQLCLTLFDLMDCNPPGSSIHEDSPGKNTGLGSHALLQGIFPIQGSNPGLPHCRRILYHLSHQRSLKILEWVAIPSPGDLLDPGIQPGSPAF